MPAKIFCDAKAPRAVFGWIAYVFQDTSPKRKRGLSLRPSLTLRAKSACAIRLQNGLLCACSEYTPPQLSTDSAAKWFALRLQRIHTPSAPPQHRFEPMVCFALAANTHPH